LSRSKAAFVQLLEQLHDRIKLGIHHVDPRCEASVCLRLTRSTKRSRVLEVAITLHILQHLLASVISHDAESATRPGVARGAEPISDCGLETHSVKFSFPFSLLSAFSKSSRSCSSLKLKFNLFRARFKNVVISSPSSLAACWRAVFRKPLCTMRLCQRPITDASPPSADSVIVVTHARDPTILPIANECRTHDQPNALSYTRAEPLKGSMRVSSSRMFDSLSVDPMTRPAIVSDQTAMTMSNISAR
jgi:hypothetical protein